MKLDTRFQQVPPDIQAYSFQVVETLQSICKNISWESILSVRRHWVAFYLLPIVLRKSLPTGLSWTSKAAAIEWASTRVPERDLLQHALDVRAGVTDTSLDQARAEHLLTHIDARIKAIRQREAQE
ncbi:hypothetical protein KDW_38070 [Dictyobacter vulcani]|uniref:Adenylyltransferase AadA C-terminal domain-containing protein n=1 Tax=Dictyobacter vulcani TaxID=2607529 RepID=A0A5J4KP58_9CHLR|nr:hypothetical protein [Dictyobacter vulcani]GER89645.1 hypothetical protein KDW_38070 [Dictyobacter vulcani]